MSHNLLIHNLEPRTRNPELGLLMTLLMACAMAIVPIVSMAQADTDKSEESSVRILEEIIVTAEKREQNLQNVPASISAFTADMLDARGITTPQDLQYSVPGLTIAETERGGTAKVTIRGIGTELVIPGGDPGVPMHINGHYTQSSAYMLRDFLDVERVEVQRGPQGTLYGRNAMGGNINIITKRPTEEFEALLSANVGNYDKRQIQALVSGPLSDRLRGRLVFSDDNRDGYVENIGSAGDDRDTSDYTSIRAALEFDLTDDIQLDLDAYYFDDEGNNHPRNISDYPTAPTFLGAPNFWILRNAPPNITKTDPFKVRTGTASKQTDESKGVSLDVSWDLGGMEFRSLSAYDDSFRAASYDVDGSDVIDHDVQYNITHEVFTQEFQLLSKDDDALQWVVGLFYYHEDSNLDFASRRTSSDTNDDGLIVIGEDMRREVFNPVVIGSTSTAVYGQLDYSLTDQLELVGGLRYTKDKKERTDGLGIGFVGLPLFFVPSFTHGGDEEWSEVTGKFGLNYHISDEAMAYASYSTGYKSGGFNFFEAGSFDPETVASFEVGLKSQWLDNRLQMNVSAFYYDYRDKQDLQSIAAFGFSALPNLINASAATTTGVEIEAQAYISDAFQLDLSLTYLDAEFDEFDTVDNAFPALGIQDLSGNTLPFSPEWKMHVGAQYEWLLGANLGSLTARADYSWVDDQWVNAFNRKGDPTAFDALGLQVLPGNGDFLPSYHMVNARLQWHSSDETWLAEFYAKNLTDEVVQTSAFIIDQSLHATYLPPRTYGFKLTYRF